MGVGSKVRGVLMSGETKERMKYDEVASTVIKKAFLMPDRCGNSVAKRIYELCRERKWTPNHLAIVSAVPQATIKSILNGESQNPGIVTIKKLCDGFDISLSEFFTTPEFEELEQEIK